MKKTKVLLLALLLSANCIAQKVLSGNFVLPQEEKYIAIDWDCSATVFEKKYDEKEWMAIKGESEWNTAKSDALGRFLKEMNEKLEKSKFTAIRAGSELKAGYTLYICPSKLDEKGNNNSLYVLKKNDTNEEIGRAQMKGDGGHWGSLGNLLGDGYEKAGAKMGSLIKKQNKLK